ncbi:MAG: hypothetical protein OEY38_12860 [Gammaproteobacteria bacterium]|nr:hypothetical protein [Gammaproteobacteria bacterium]
MIHSIFTILLALTLVACTGNTENKTTESPLAGPDYIKYSVNNEPEKLIYFSQNGSPGLVAIAYPHRQRLSATNTNNASYAIYIFNSRQNNSVDLAQFNLKFDDSKDQDKGIDIFFGTNKQLSTYSAGIAYINSFNKNWPNGFSSIDVIKRDHQLNKILIKFDAQLCRDHAVLYANCANPDNRMLIRGEIQVSLETKDPVSSRLASSEQGSVSQPIDFNIDTIASNFFIFEAHDSRSYYVFNPATDSNFEMMLHWYGAFAHLNAISFKLSQFIAGSEKVVCSNELAAELNPSSYHSCSGFKANHPIFLEFSRNANFPLQKRADRLFLYVRANDVTPVQPEQKLLTLEDMPYQTTISREPNGNLGYSHYFLKTEIDHSYLIQLSNYPWVQFQTPQEPNCQFDNGRLVNEFEQDCVMQNLETYCTPNHQERLKTCRFTAKTNFTQVSVSSTWHRSQQSINYEVADLTLHGTSENPVDLGTMPLSATNRSFNFGSHFYQAHIESDQSYELTLLSQDTSHRLIVSIFSSNDFSGNSLIRSCNSEFHLVNAHCNFAATTDTVYLKIENQKPEKTTAELLIQVGGKAYAFKSSPTNPISLSSEDNQAFESWLDWRSEFFLINVEPMQSYRLEINGETTSDFLRPIGNCAADLIAPGKTNCFFYSSDEVSFPIHIENTNFESRYIDGFPISLRLLKDSSLPIMSESKTLDVPSEHKGQVAYGQPSEYSIAATPGSLLRVTLSNLTQAAELAFVFDGFGNDTCLNKPPYLLAGSSREKGLQDRICEIYIPADQNHVQLFVYNHTHGANYNIKVEQLEY